MLTTVIPTSSLLMYLMMWGLNVS